jgi:hypothetical protein
MPDPKLGRFLTVPQVAEELATSSAQIMALLKRGHLVGIQIGGRGQWRIERAKLRRNWRALLTLSVLASVTCLAAMVAEVNGVAAAPNAFEFAILWTLLRMGPISLLALEEGDLVSPATRVPRAELSEDFKHRIAG